MLKMSNLKKNLAYNLIFQILNIIVPIFTAPYVFRILGKDGIGIYGYTFSIAHYFSLACMLGILNYGNREISMVSDDREKRSKVFWQIYCIQFLAGFLSIVSYLILVGSLKSAYNSVFMVQGFIVLTSMFDICWLYFGMEDFRFTTNISMLNKALTTALIFLLVKNNNHVFLYAAIISIGCFLNVVIYWACLRKYVSFNFGYFKHFILHLRPILILFIPVIAINIYKYIDKIMLGSMLSVTEVGTFEAAEKLENLPMCLIAAIGTVMLPRISNMVANKQAESVNYYNRMSFLLVMFLTFGMAFGLSGIAKPFIPLFYGAGYEDSYMVLIWLLPSMVFVGWANIIRTQYLLPNRKDTLFCASVIAGAIVNVICNLILIPRFASVGAAISTTVAEFTVCCFQSIVAYKDMKLLQVMKRIAPFLLLGGIMYLVIDRIIIGGTVVTIIVRIIVGAAIYGILSFAFYGKDITPLLPHKKPVA